MKNFYAAQTAIEALALALTHDNYRVTEKQIIECLEGQLIDEEDAGELKDSFKE